MRYDVETLFEDLVANIKSNLNAQISAINTEKGDTVLSTFNTDAWITGSLDERVMNYDNVVFSYIENLSSTVNGFQIATNINIEIDLLIAQKEDTVDYKRILRYQRALQQAASLAWDKVGKGYDRATISILSPLDIKLFDSSYWTKVIGIQMEFSLTN